MVSVVLPVLNLSDASPLHVAVGALAAALVAYKLLASKPAHERYAAKHGLTGIKPAKRLPQTHFLLGDTMELGRNATRFVDWMYEKTVELDEQPWLRHVPSLPDSITVATPELIEDVTKTQNDIFGKGESTRTIFDDFVGSSFFTQDGAPWFHQRKLASKFFSARMFREVAMVKFAKHTETMLGVLEKACGADTEVNISHLLHEFTLQVISELAFGLEMDLIGSDQSHPLNDALEEAFPQILTRIQTPEWLWKLQKYLNIGGERKYRYITGEIRRIVSEMIAKSVDQNLSRVGPRREPTTIVELFIHAMQDGEADWISPELLRDIGIMFVIGGRDTTAETLAWMLFMVGKHPEVEKKLRDELWRKVPELMEGKVKSLSMEQVHTLTYMEATIKETLRFYPPVPLSQREAACDTHLVDGTFVPKGTTVGISTYTLGRLRSVWGDDVHEFKPERFVDEATDKPISHSAFKFASFSAGPRICIGMNLALLELKLVVATMFSRFRLETAPNDGSFRFSASLPLKNPLMARIRPANAATK